MDCCNQRSPQAACTGRSSEPALPGLFFPCSWPPWALGPWAHSAAVPGWQVRHVPTLGKFTCPRCRQLPCVAGRELAGGSALCTGELEWLTRLTGDKSLMP